LAKAKKMNLISPSVPEASKHTASILSKMAAGQ
jgi:hypothetical protein